MRLWSSEYEAAKWNLALRGHQVQPTNFGEVRSSNLGLQPIGPVQVQASLELRARHSFIQVAEDPHCEIQYERPYHGVQWPFGLYNSCTPSRSSTQRNPQCRAILFFCRTMNTASALCSGVSAWCSQTGGQRDWSFAWNVALWQSNGLHTIERHSGVLH